MLNYPIGPKTAKQAAETLPGRLAALLNDVLYNAYVSDSAAAKVKLVLNVDTNCEDIDLPIGIQKVRDGYANTEQILRVIRDYLEWHSFREVIP